MDRHREDLVVCEPAESGFLYLVDDVGDAVIQVLAGVAGLVGEGLVNLGQARDVRPDGFLESLGVDRGKYIVKNPDGSIGYDAIRALSDTAVRDWRTEE